MARVALIVALLALPSAAEEDEPTRHFLTPALESLALQFGFLTFSNLVSQEPFAHVSWQSIGSHLDGQEQWNFDTDNLLVNQLGHPYMGSLTFNAARSSGLSFWWSAAYAAMESLMWELIFEVEGLSINDQITTPIGGALLGEALHRIAETILDDGTEPIWLRYLFAAFVDPMGSLNRWLYAQDLDPFAGAHARSFGAVSVGVSLGGRVRDSTGVTRVVNSEQPFADVLFTYEMPGDKRPFSRFNFEGSVTPGAMPITTLFVRGLLWGEDFERAGGAFDQVFGVWGTYDFAQPALMRASAVGAGPGTQLSWRPSAHTAVQATAVVSWVPLGSVGAIGVDEDVFRNYHTGPGVSGVLDLRLMHTQAAMLRVLVQEWCVVGAYVPDDGYESMTYLSVGFWVKLGWRIATKLEFTGAWRAPNFQDDTYDRSSRSSNIALSLVYMSDESFGGRLQVSR